MEFDGIITLDDLIFWTGLGIFAYWVFKTSLGKKALEDSVPRRNNMPVYVPFIPLFACFCTAWLAELITDQLFGDVDGWKGEFLNNAVFCISELTAIVVMIVLAKIYFARGLRGFGLNIKTSAKDFGAAFVSLLAVWPLMMSAIGLTLYFGELIKGQEYQIQQHEQLKLIAEFPQLPLRILIFFIAVVAASLFEEMLFRGFFQTTIRSFFEARLWSPVGQETGQANQAARTNGAWPAILISSGLFTSTHANVEHWPALFVLGICLGYSYEKSGSLLRPIFIHSIYNAFSMIAVLSQ